MDTLHTAFLLHATFYYTITSFGNFLALEPLVWSLGSSVLLTGLVAFVVQVSLQRIQANSMDEVVCISVILLPSSVPYHAQQNNRSRLLDIGGRAIRTLAQPDRHFYQRRHAECHINARLSVAKYRDSGCRRSV